MKLCFILLLLFIQPQPVRPHQQAEAYNQEAEQAKYPQSEAVYLLNQGEIELKSNGRAVGKFHVRLRILNERGLDRKRLTLTTGPTRKVANFKGRTIKPDGGKRAVKDDEIFETSYVSKNRVYRDLKIKSVHFREVYVGCILDYEYTIEYKSAIDLPGWAFNNLLPVEHSRFSIRYPADMPFLFASRGDSSDIHFEKTSAGSDTLLSWAADSLPPIVVEPNMPNFRSLQQRLLYWTPDVRFENKTVSFNAWRDIAEWYDSLFEGKLNLDSAVVQRKLPALQVAQSDREKARIIFEFVRDQFRYIDIGLNEGFYEPNDAETVLRRRYGDGKDFVTVLTALLRVNGLEAYPALLRSRDFGAVIDSLFTLKQFDHLITAAVVEGDTLYIDPTYLVCPFGMLPPYAQNAQVLILKEGNDVITQTPASAAALSEFRQVYKAAFNAVGTLKAEGSIFADGLTADALAEIAKVGTKKEKDRIFESYVNAWVPGVKLTKSPFDALERRAERRDTSRTYVDGRFAFERARFLGAGKEFIFLNPNFLNQDNVPAFAVHPKEERVHPVVFDNLYIERDTIEIAVPSDYKLLSTPKSVRLDEPFAAFRAEYKLNGQTLTCARFFVLKTLRIEKSDYNHMREFYIKIAKVDDDEIILKKAAAGAVTENTSNGDKR